MKKLAVMLAVAMTLSLAGCTASTGVAQAEYDELKAKYDEVVAERDALQEALDSVSILDGLVSRPSYEPDPEPEPTDAFDEETVLSQLEVTELFYHNNYWNYAFLVIKNNSEYDLDISAAVKFYNSVGELIGAEDGSESPIGVGQEVILYFMPDERIASMEYELSASEEDWYESAVNDLTYESVPAKNKEIMSVTNNGTETAEFVQGYALFFKGGQVVEYSSAYFVDDDSELKPGKTVTKELSCYEDYDSVKFFVTGRRYK